ncbi:hypothetical protein ACFWH4_04785 [Streptomyces sp. NPDC127091]|uniref:hypothetical protein n=1 Tax=Streptomyces sp. NPDC127091 TaxID=3347134 RepID=UPI00365A9760
MYDVDGWKITLDVRPQHQRVWKDLRRSDVYVMTHVMEIRRLDGGTFTATEAKPVLSALRVALSFALGRWVAPALPVGQDANGKIVWEEWRPLLCDPARKISSGWWYHEDQAALQDLLNRVIPAFCDTSREKPLRLQMQYAITATADRGFVEQRIMIGAAGLEHIIWQNLRLTGRLTKRQYGSGEWTTRQMLRTVLEDAGIDVDINPAHLPVAAGFAAERAQRSGQPVNGADLVKWVRNELVHPKEAQEPLYRIPGLTTDLWLLTRHYLVLLILHSIDYRGSYRDLAKTNGWVGEVEPVPWA